MKIIDEVRKKDLYIDLDSIKAQYHIGQEETSKKRYKNMVSIAKKRMDPNRHCKHCDVDGNKEEKCWKFHSELHPRWLKSKGKEKETTKTKEEVVESTFDMDEAVVFTTLQRPKASGDKHALF